MQYKYSLLTAASLVGSSIAAYIPSEPWATLTPKEPAPSGAVTDYTKTFGIAVVPFATSSAAPKAKRDVVSQIGDGQIQATTATAKPSAQVVSQIGDGQIQATTSTAPAPKPTAQVVSQIGDGQIQATTSTAKPTAQVVSQIGDGQIQATTSTAPAPKPTAQVVSQIGDGQIQATTSTAKPTAQVVSQIGDGQIQATTSTAAPKSTAQVVSQIGDGQIQATTSTAQVVSQIGDGQIQATTKTTDVASQIGDGQVQATSTASSAKATESSSGKDSGIDVQSSSCLTDSSLALTLKDSVLTDAHGRIGSIVANRQFQFDGPPPQAGAIYAAGWSITEDGNLAIGNVSTFYQCLSGNFYNLYDESLGEQCHPIHLEIVDLVKC